MTATRWLRDRLRAALAEPEPDQVTPEPQPDTSAAGCKCAPAPIQRGPKFGGTVIAAGRGLPGDNGLRQL